LQARFDWASSICASLPPRLRMRGGHFVFYCSNSFA
jgi:hypothetical protein